MDLLLGIDMGTGSTKGVLVDTAGSVLASETIPHSMALPRPGWAEVDAESVWWREVCAIGAALMAKMPVRRPPRRYVCQRRRTVPGPLR